MDTKNRVIKAVKDLMREYNLRPVDIEQICYEMGQEERKEDEAWRAKNPAQFD